MTNSYQKHLIIKGVYPKGIKYTILQALEDLKRYIENRPQNKEKIDLRINKGRLEGIVKDISFNAIFNPRKYNPEGKVEMIYKVSTKDTKDRTRKGAIELQLILDNYHGPYYINSDNSIARNRNE